MDCELIRQFILVEERSYCIEAGLVRARGVVRSENVGMSSVFGGENPPRRKTKVSWAM